MTKNKNYTKNGNKGYQKNPDKYSLGRTLFKSRFNNDSYEVGEKEKWLHTSAISTETVQSFVSLTEQNSLDEFLNTAELAGVDFEAEKLNLNFAQPKVNAGILDASTKKIIKETQAKFKDICLRIPRKPFWQNEDLDGPTLQRKEREAFLEWRRQLALAQTNEHLSMTPFEKNLDFWRQLWRVIERSDVIVQIVDARNPTLFHCEDLEAYVKEVDENKQNLLLINKSDYLSEKQRLAWLKYFEAKNIHVVFWSAALATDINMDAISEVSELTEETDNVEEDDEIESETETEEEEESTANQSGVSNKFNFLLDEKNDEDSSNEQSAEDTECVKSVKDSESVKDVKHVIIENEIKTQANWENKIKEDINNNKKNSVSKNTDQITLEVTKSETEKNPNVAEETKVVDYEITKEDSQKCKILNKSELLTLFKTVHKSVDKAKPGITTIGLVGYPNVGKSSTINAILQDKKVAVSDTPGKTKHYQTLYFDDELLLCDCPGLVFPSFVSTRGELILNGILSIDQMRDYNEPSNICTTHIPRNVFEMYYGITIPKPKEYEDQNRVPTAEELCSTYAIYRGYMNHKGMPDVSRAARLILKDYVNGKLLYCYPPPGIDGATFQDHKYEQSKEVKYFEKTKKLQLQKNKSKPKASNFDREFFDNLEVKALSKGGVVGAHRVGNIARKKGCDLNASLDSQLENKFSKKHYKKKGGGGKLRRVTSHFDKIDLN